MLDQDKATVPLVVEQGFASSVKHTRLGRLLRAEAYEKKGERKISQLLVVLGFER